MILGLPRSRTAWLANFMTYGGSFCYHELMTQSKSVREMKNKLDLEYQYTGFADTAAHLVHKEFDCPKVVIHRNVKDSNYSSQKLYDTGFDFTEILKAAEAELYLVDGLHIRFDEINDRLEDIWTYCTDLPFDHKRAELLKDMKIETNKIHFSNDDLGFIIDEMKGVR